MANDYPPYRTHRRRKKTRAGRLGLAGALTGALGIAAVAVTIVILRPDGGAGGAAPTAPAGQGGADAGPSVPSPRAGPPLNFTTPEGYGYSLAAVEAGTDPAPLGEPKAPPPGTTYAYADYLLTNNQRRPVLLDYPADLFMPKSQVPASARERCMPQAGVPDDMCTLPNRSEVTARVDGAEPPIDENGTTMMPAGATYLVRIASELPVKDGVSPGDLGLFVWNARYTSDLTGIELAFPNAAG
ncbi:hypothetical protein E1200_12650 [Actinomadura sp. GC306]|uniref:hypothetical protein n=1 Tax=Actinomadura sp. GC306 TaxID=2530367 RepID=UPI001046A3AF|nr:hypothetical protein [Actinomadura sp. GC306]TDC68114.1 hypothetical protein E1200_12650 [Actinomadura sp. GC306]